MRTETSGGITIQYADEIGFAFMPCIVKVTGSDVTSIELTIKGGGKSYHVVCDAFNDGCVMDYREYIQSLFDGASKGNIDYSVNLEFDSLGMEVDFTLYVMDGEQVAKTFPFTSFYVWGAMRPGETWGGYKRLTWFTNYPFSFGLYAASETRVLIGYEGSPQKELHIDSKGMFNVMSQNLDKGARYSMIYSYDSEIKQATFNDIFDLSFLLGGGTQRKLLRIDFDDSDDGMYLRWIDRHGFYRYWLFVVGDQSREVASDGEYMRNNLWAYADMVGYMGSYGRRQRYQRKDTVSLCAPSVDTDTFDMLQDITSSPVVDLYLGGDANNNEDKWQSVTIKAGTYTKTGATLQDFICQLEFNDINIQAL